MKSFQFQRPNPRKPLVCKYYEGGMWWAQVNDADGKYISKCFFTYAEALAKALELAEMNKEAAK